MGIKQIRLSKMDVFCYMIGNEDSRTCALIDPAFDTDRILAKVSEDGYRVTHVINTHGHSDHSAGNAAVIAKTGASLAIHHADSGQLGGISNSAFSRLLGGKGSPKPDILLKDKDIIKIGNTRLSVIHTPGHTPGSICIYLPGHVFTGDTLFVGAVGRTDLPGGSAKQLLASITEKIYVLPADTRVWPGHDYGETPFSTVEQEKRTNPFTKGYVF
jgi:glyoxylase-like metal-dependent hydrolase (beta-lactamase superfamily II)